MTAPGSSRPAALSAQRCPHDRHGHLRALLMNCDVAALWEGAGSPAPNWQGKARSVRDTPPTRRGVCALTGDPGAVVDARHVLSGLFTRQDQFRHRDADPAGLAFGPAACWALRHRAGMQQPHSLVDGRLSPVTPEGLFRALLDLPDHPTWWVGVPQSKQMHITPWARLGTVRVDNEDITWTSNETTLLRRYAAIRALGFGETAITETVPRWPILVKLNSADRARVTNGWAQLDPWREHQSLLDIAARATRTVKEDTK